MRACLLVLITAVGCHHQPHVQSVPVPVAKEPAAQPASAEPAKPAPASPNVAVSQDLAKQCTLDLGNRARAPKFDFDRSELLAEDRDVLEQVATCVTTGPLSGRRLELVGRADPRGTEEYNLGLGSQRAAMVRDFLQRLGVKASQLAQTTRGSLDASGSEESGWREDRRVDLRLSRR